MGFVRVMLLSVCVHGLGFAQAVSNPLEFEVASVKQVAPPGAGMQTGGARSTGIGSMSEAPDRISYQGVTLKRMLLKAYDLKPFQISGPGWLDDERYDVSATIPDGAAKELVPEMLQNLLVERFRIVLHSEMKDEAVYVLSVGKGGPKLHPSANGQRESVGFRSHAEESQVDLIYSGQTMARFADGLSRDLGRAVTDQTGLDGKFDFTLQAEAQAGSFAPLPSSLFNAVRDLGLQLKPGKAPSSISSSIKRRRYPHRTDAA